MPVKISVTASNEYMDPALSVYAGWKPYAAHDNDPMDQTSYAFTPNRKKHPTDSAPNDPNIRHHLYDLATKTYSENSIWNTPDPNGVDLGGLTLAQWYQANYQPHNGYRYTLNYTAFGGDQVIVENGVQSVVAANYNPAASLIEGYYGQSTPSAIGAWP